jgi:hypothetical protein
MLRKLSTFAIALFGLLVPSLVAAGQDAGTRNPATAVAADDKSPASEAKQTDKELIAKQKTCPVSDEQLGSMGKPVKVVVKGRRVFLCCAGCKKKFLANVDKYLKKLDEQQKQDEQKQTQ